MDDCDSVPKMRPEDQWFKACRFDIKDLGASCVKQQSFGYEDGQPCVLMKLNRVSQYLLCNLNPCNDTVKPVLSSHSKKTKNWFSRPIIV